jgi:hypothetical protein
MSETTTELEPGIFYDIPMYVYQTWPAVNPSLAKHAGKSLKQYQHARTAKQKPPTPAMLKGTAVHCTVLEPDEFPLRYVIWEGRKAGKAFDEFATVNADKVILSADEYDTLIAMRKAVHGHKIAGPIVTDPMMTRETCIVWRDEDTGLLCKGRMDMLGRGWIGDLKTIHTLDERWITRHCCDYGYHVSMAAYQSGLKALTGKAADIKLVFVCTDAPHDVAVVRVADEALECGQRKWSDLLEKIAAAELANQYPGVAENGEMFLILPEYEINSDPETLDLDFSKE